MRARVVLSSVLVLPAAHAAFAQDRLQSRDLLKLRSVGGVQVSPDATRVAYIVENNDGARRPYGQLWVMTIADGKTVRFGGDRESSGNPTWAPDGQSIAYNGRVGDKSGLVVARPDGSGARFLAGMSDTNSPLPTTGKTVAWAPDGKRIAFVSSVPGPETADATGDPIVIPRYLYKPDAAEGMTRFNDNRRLHIFVVDVASGRIEQLTDGTHYEHSIDWSPSGEEIAFVSNREPEVYLDALGAQRISDPRTAGDFCRRFGVADIEALQTAINATCRRVWRAQPADFFDEAVVDADGTLVETTGQCKEGMDIAYNGVWGYHPLLVSLANTGEPLSLVNRSGNRPSAEGAAERFDQARTLCQDAGFRRITFRGDTDVTQTRHLDRWDADGVRFVFGCDARANVIRCADALPARAWTPLVRRARDEVETAPRQRPVNVKAATIVEREFKNLRLEAEAVAEFPYQPTACTKPYRMVVVRKNISVEQGDHPLFDEIRYFFYLTNDRDTPAADIVFLANDRCHQENLTARATAVLSRGPRDRDSEARMALTVTRV